MASARRPGRRAVSARTLVFKLGSRLLTGEDGRLNHANMERLANEIGGVWQQGHNVVLVTSGAVAAGFPLLGLTQPPRSVVERQAAASVGQARLMHLYQTMFNSHGILLGQVLLTRAETQDRNRFLNARNTLGELLSRRILPVVNENDAVASEELKLGDNDTLAAVTSALVSADLCALLTDVEGILAHRDDPASVIPSFHTADEAEMLLWEKESKLSTGGMATKLQAARINADYGIPTIIANGLRSGVIPAIAAGEAVGTRIRAAVRPLNARHHWMRHAAVAHGQLQLDRGALSAIRDNGKSLLPSGIVGVEGEFVAGDVVALFFEQRPIAWGIVQYDSDEIRKIQGCQSGEIESRLGYRIRDDVVHHNDMVFEGEHEQ